MHPGPGSLPATDVYSEGEPAVDPSFQEMRMTLPSRRSFHHTLLGSLTAYSLIETLFQQDLFADAVRPVINRWMLDLNELCQDLKEHKLQDTDFQAKLEELYRKVNLADLVRLVDLDR